MHGKEAGAGEGRLDCNKEEKEEEDVISIDL